MGPLPDSILGHKYILVFLDDHTQYTIAILLRSISARIVLVLERGSFTLDCELLCDIRCTEIRNYSRWSSSEKDS